MPAWASLPPDWQAWIKDNLARACSPREMADCMARSGQYSLAQARAVIDEALGAGPAPLPGIDTGANRLWTPERGVDILMALNQPRVVLLGDVLEVDECEALVAHCAGRYGRATVTSEADGHSAVHRGRTSAWPLSSCI